MENEVFLYCEEHDNVDFTELAEQFGTPEELASDFLPEINVHAVRGLVQMKHRLLILLVVTAMIAIVVAVSVEVYSRYRQKQVLSGQYIEEITYEEDLAPYTLTPTVPFQRP